MHVRSKEQMIFFIQYYCRKEEKEKTKFLSVESVLEQGESCSANAAMLFQVFCSKLKELGLDVTKVNGMASDGAPLGCSCVTFAFPHALFFLPPAQFLAASRLSSGLPHKSSSLLRPDLCLLWSLVTFAFPRARFLLPPAQFLVASMVSFSLLLEST